MLLCDGLCRLGGYCLQLCEETTYNCSDSTANVFSVSCLLLVPHLLSADGDVDEQDWAQEDSSAQSHRHLVFIATPHLWRVIRLMLVSFSLLGIGNALMQTSLNPLVSTVMKGGNLASTLTFGQFVKGYRLLHGTLSRHVGSASQHPSLWSWMACLIPYLSCNRRSYHSLALLNSYQGRAY